MATTKKMYLLMLANCPKPHRIVCQYKLGWFNVRIRNWFRQKPQKQALKIKVIGKDKIHANRSPKEATLDQTTV